MYRIGSPKHEAFKERQRVKYRDNYAKSIKDGKCYKCGKNTDTKKNGKHYHACKDCLNKDRRINGKERQRIRINGPETTTQNSI